MKTQQPIASEDEHRVLKFRPRTTAQPLGRRGNPGEPALKQDVDREPNDLARYERREMPSTVVG